MSMNIRRLALVVSVGGAICIALLGGDQQQTSAQSTTTDATSAPRVPLFRGWAKPEFALFITGRQNGYIEPCGCTGLEFQKGGLARRQTLYADLTRNRGWEVVPIDVGNQVRRFGVQPSIKFHTTLDALKKMNYRAVGLGPDDMRLSIGDLLVALTGNDDGSTPLVSANISLLGMSVSDGHKIIEAGGHKIGITGFLGKKELQAIKNDEIEFVQPEPAVRGALQVLQRAGCDFLVLLAHASTQETLATARKFPQFDIVVTAGGADEPAHKPEKIEGTPKSYLVQTGKKGMHVGVLGYFGGSNPPWRFQRVPLDARFKDSPEMLQALKSYQQQLETMYQSGPEQLGIRPINHPSGNTYVGSAACQDCHEGAFEKWQTTPHHHATDAIAFPGERSSIPRHFDPECLSCHVTGWDPQNYFPYVSGYLDFEKSKLLHGNGCENCHGPGSAHVAAEKKADQLTSSQLEALREAVRLPLDEARDHCLKCHDQDNDPDFQKVEAFEEYWSEIEHYD